MLRQSYIVGRCYVIIFECFSKYFQIDAHECHVTKSIMCKYVLSQSFANINVFALRLCEICENVCVCVYVVKTYWVK